MKFSLFLAFLFSFLTLKIVDESGAGGDENDPKDDDNGDPGKDDDPKDIEDKDIEDGGDEKIEDKVARLEKIIDDNEASRATSAHIEEISSRHEDFDEEQIITYLEKLKESDPEKASALNNPIGWEMIHLREFATKDVDNEYIGHGREGEQVDRSEEILEQVQTNRVSVADEAVVLKKFL